MDFIDDINIQLYHKEKIDQYGQGTTGALGWKTLEGQIARFEALSQIGNLNSSSVLDAGCGHGDLCGYLNEKFTGVRYFGIDRDASFLDIAIQKYSHLDETAFFLGDFTTAQLPATDYILACGALSYHNTDPGFVFKVIPKLFNSCRVGLGFNLLSRIDSPGGILIAYDSKQIMEHCQSLTPNVVFKVGYFDDDYTMFLYH